MNVLEQSQSCCRLVETLNSVFLPATPQLRLFIWCGRVLTAEWKSFVLITFIYIVSVLKNCQLWPQTRGLKNTHFLHEEETSWLWIKFIFIFFLVVGSSKPFSLERFRCHKRKTPKLFYKLNTSSWKFSLTRTWFTFKYDWKMPFASQC